MSEQEEYRRFWDGVGSSFPDLGGAASTEHYFESERRLFRDLVPDLRKQRLFKTDLWDEARNTRILQWTQTQGAVAFGVDIAGATVAEARRAFPPGALHAAVGDVRALPFRSGSFDLIYSMGTIEHFDEPELALQEMNRVLRPGGRALVGVPNLHDPFLRPLLVWVLRRIGLYAYGDERAFSRREFAAMLERNGFVVEAESSILFEPGFLRMADLALHCWCRPLTILTRPWVRLFAAWERRSTWAKRHGYLLATLARKV